MFHALASVIIMLSANKYISRIVYAREMYLYKIAL